MLPLRINYLELLALKYESVFSDLLLICWIVFEKCEGQTESSPKVQKARNFVAVSMFLTQKDHLWEGTSKAWQIPVQDLGLRKAEEGSQA